MKEELISFNTAKLAEEKKFDEQVSYMYGQQDNHQLENFDANMYIMWNLTKAPTQSLLQRWLREKHELSVYVQSNASGWYWTLEKVNGTFIKDWEMKGTNEDSGMYDTYEEALEIGLFEALNHIK